MFEIFAAKRRSVSATKTDSHDVFSKKWLILAVSSFLLAAAVYGWQYFQINVIFPITRVKVVDTATHVDPSAVETIALMDVRSGFFRLNINDLQARLAQLPWVANVAVMREWPNEVTIRMSEYQPLARWSRQSLITADGTIFNPERMGTIPAHLPLLSGPDIQAETIVSYYEIMEKMLVPLHRHIQEIDVSTRLAWNVILDNGLRLDLGETAPLQRFSVFVAAYPQIFTQPDRQADYIDMRYDHGIAVHWQKETPKKTSVNLPLLS